MTRFAGTLAAFTAVVGFLLGLVVAGSPPRRAPGVDSLHRAEPPLVVSTAPGPVPVANGSSVDFSAVAAGVNAAVVNVDAAIRGDGRTRTGPRWRREIADDP